WPKWMQALNKYPVRYPALPIPLGHALAAIPQSKLPAYLDALTLERDGHMRIQVTQCLAAFQDKASRKQALCLWAAAFKRWDQWDFELLSSNDIMFDVATSTLDFAVVAYIVECMSEAERE